MQTNSPLSILKKAASPNTDTR